MNDSAIATMCGYPLPPILSTSDQRTRNGERQRKGTTVIDRNELDLRIKTHWNQIETVNQTQCRAAESFRPASVLRPHLANVLVSMAAKLDSRFATENRSRETTNHEAASSLAS